MCFVGGEPLRLTRPRSAACASLVQVEASRSARTSNAPKPNIPSYFSDAPARPLVSPDHVSDMKAQPQG